MESTPRWGITLPLRSLPLPGQRDLVAALPGLGYTDAWSSEVNGADAFAPLADRLAQDEQRIVEELAAAQGSEVDLGGYYLPDADRVGAAMRPSQTLNSALEEFAG